MPHQTLIRPLGTGDVDAVERLTGPSGPPLDHLLSQDPGGCWGAEHRGELVGAVAALNRELMWLLGSLAVRPDLRQQGIGRQLFEVSMTHGRGCLRGMLSAPAHPAAVRLVRRSGFSVHPCMQATGPVPRAVLPVLERTREGSPGDVDLMDSVDRQVRGAAHGVDHPWLAANHPLRVMDRTTGSGYVYLAPGGGPLLLAATNRRTAVELLWESLAATSPDVPVTVSRIGAANGWALDVVLEAGLTATLEGILGVREMRPPTTYLPHPQLL